MGSNSPARAPGALRRGLAAAAVVLALPAIGGCAAGFNAQTNQVYQPAEGVNDRSGDVYAIHVLVVTDGAGNGTLVAALINQTDKEDFLQSVTATDAEGNSVEVQNLSSEPIALAPHELEQLAGDGQIRLQSDALEAGTYVTIELVFANASPVELEVPIVETGSDYADVPVGPPPEGAA